MNQSKLIDSHKDMIKKSLWYLCTEELGFSDWGKVHDDMEKFLKKPSRRKLMLVPRGHLKSSLTKSYAVQLLLNDPNHRVLIANQVWDRARDMLYEIKEWLTTKSNLPKYFGNFVSGRWREEEIVIAQRTKALSAPSIGTTGVESELTSAHYDTIILDDVQGLQNCQTKEQRDKVKRFYRTLTAILEPGGQIIIPATRWHYDDLYQEIIDNESDYYDIMIRQVIEKDEVIFPKKFNLKFDSKVKDWVYSETPTMDYINYLKQNMGNEFYSQYMNLPMDSGSQVIKREYFKYWDRRPDGLFIALTLDPAISYQQRSDYSAFVVCGMDSKRNIYVLDYLRGHWADPSKIIENLLKMVDKWKPNTVGIESMGFQKTLKYWIEQVTMTKRHVPPITELKAPPTQKKEFRLKALEPYYRNGMVYHANWMKGKELEEELTLLAEDGYKGKHDDLFDALAHQLDVLYPGGISGIQEEKEWTWEWCLKRANEFNGINKGFFGYER